MYKKIIFALGIVLIISIGVGIFYANIQRSQNELISHKENDSIDEIQHKVSKIAIQKDNENSEQKSQQIEEVTVKKANLFSYDNSVPLFVISQIADVSPAVQSKLDDIIDNTSLYFYKNNGDENIVILGNSGEEKYMRHDVRLLSFNGNEEVCLAFDDMLDEDVKKNNKWKFDKDTNLPLEHIKYSEKNIIEYKEIWNYSDDEPIKYELKDGEDNTISLKKETKENESNIRIENILYDKDGSIKINISLSYEGADVVRFTYYNSENIDDSRTIMYEYQNGEKVKEVIYSSDYKKQNTYLSEYKDGELTQIRILDPKDFEFAKILPL